MEHRTAQQIWEVALGELQLQVSRQNYRTWLEKSKGLSHENNQFVIGTPNTFVTEYLDKKLRSLIEKTLIGLTGRDIGVAFQVDNHRQNHQGNTNRTATTTPDNNPAFISRYTFSSFVTGNCNQLAHAAAVRVVEKPGRVYNPLFIYGGVGLGKTHLLCAIGQAALGKRLKVLYASAERFTNEFVTAIHEKKTGEFRNRYRSVDMLLIDDIQFLIGKEQTEEVFFHTFNALHSTERQIAVTCDLPPQSLPLLQKRLCSRFEGGLVVSIEPPDISTRLSILQAKTKKHGIEIPPDALEVIARSAVVSVRQLEGMLNRVIAYAGLTGAAITPELTAEAISDITATTPRTTPPTPERIIQAVAISSNLSPTELKTRKRDKQTALARKLAMYLLRQETGISFSQVGLELGGRDHSTVMYACENIAHELKTNPELGLKVSAIYRRLYPKSQTDEPSLHK